MSIENMTNMSYFLFAVAALSALGAVVIFFTMDIPKCWRMCFGMEPVHKRQVRANRMHEMNRRMTEETNGLEFFGESEATLLLKDEAAVEYGPAKETLPLGDKMETEYMGAGKTVLLYGMAGEEHSSLPGTDKLELIQDIVYMQEKESRERCDKL